MPLKFSDFIATAPEEATNLSLEEQEDYDAEAKKLRNLSVKQNMEG